MAFSKGFRKTAGLADMALAPVKAAGKVVGKAASKALSINNVFNAAGAIGEGVQGYNKMTAAATR